ncbi:MAG: SURF1 family protein [Gemmatimonadales bacterium]|nr:SURF1 family protein [Gemmatimonadales bacterium]
MSPTSRRILVALLLLAGAACAWLGFWQLDRLRERRVANRIAQHARDAAVVRLPEGLGAAGDLAHRRIVAVGRYDAANEIVVRGQVLNGLPGVHVVTPLRMAGTEVALLVNRGFVPSPDAVTAETDSLQEGGEVRAEGVALPLSSGGGRPIERREQTTWGRLDRDALTERIPYPVLPVYLLQLPDSGLSRLPRRLAAPPLGEGSHLNYAVQWFLFGGMSVVFAVIFVARGDRLPRAPS